MRILIDIGHPAHVHYFKNIIHKLNSENYIFLITARNKEVAHLLLKAYEIPFTSRGSGKDGLLNKVLYTLEADIKIYKIAKKFNPDLFLSFASPYAAHVAQLLRKKHIAFDDTENATFAHKLYRPFTHKIYSPLGYKGKLHKRQILFNGFMELCYLHPRNFSPDPNILSYLKVERGEPYAILRFVSWKANHDIGHKGLSLQHKIKVVEELSKHAKVFITSEKELPKDLERYRISIPPEKMHHALAFAKLLYGESATMASECAMLGVPSIFHDNVGRGYTNRLEIEYDLVYNFDESPEGQEKGLAKALNIIQQDTIDNYKINREKLLNDTINVNELMESSIKEALY